MQRHSSDPEVFIRSLASRGHLGGLTASTEEICLVMDAMGKDIIILETVGVGQDEVEVVDLAHTSILVTVPGLGDDVQAIKAGVMEIGNIFVVNKADREGADRAFREIVSMLDMISWEGRFRPPVLMVQAHNGVGIDELVEKIYTHKKFLEENGLFHKFFSKRAKKMFEKVLMSELGRRLKNRILADVRWKEWEESLENRKIDPYTLAFNVLEEMVTINSKSK